VRWRFLREPKWVIRHVAVVVLITSMVAAGLWQLQRLADKRDSKALVEARQEQPAMPVEEVATGGRSAADVQYRAVTATGTFLDQETVVVENRSLNGSAGAWVLTPLQLGDGRAVVVNRGFVGFDRDGEIVAPPAPAGQVEVPGQQLPGQYRGRIRPRDPADGRLDVLARVDLARYQAQVDEDLLPVYVQAVSSDPPEPDPAADAPRLVALGATRPTEGPHLSYAVQWFTFSAIAAGGYVLLLRRVARDRGPSRRGDRRTAARRLTMRH
jgi:cytochrome oxidase assembly protein ShyY1